MAAVGEIQAVKLRTVRLPTPQCRRRLMKCRLLLKRRSTPTSALHERPLTVGLILARCGGERAEAVEVVRVSGLSLTEIASDVGWRFAALRVVDLSDNQISSLAPLANCLLLKRLDVASNALSSFADVSPGAFRLLERLDVSYNLFKAEALFGKESLLSRLPRLQTLVADGNGLRQLPELKGTFRELRHLSVRYNALDACDVAALKTRKTLKSLDVRGNGLRSSTPRERFEKGRFSRPPVFVPVPDAPTRRSVPRPRPVAVSGSVAAESLSSEGEELDARWRWREVEDPTVQVALRLGLDPNALEKSPKRIVEPATALRQILAQNWPRYRANIATWSHLRPTVSSYRKQRFFGRT